MAGQEDESEDVVLDVVDLSVEVGHRHLLSAAGMLEYVTRGFGDGHVAAVTAWLVYIANIIVTAMVAVSFGSYASGASRDTSAAMERNNVVAWVENAVDLET